MAYIDDWYSTHSQIRAALEEVCSANFCAHSRYQHGDSRVQRMDGTTYQREVVNTPGTCTMCRCKVFREPNAITPDDVLDTADFLSGIETLDQLLGGQTTT